MAKNNFRRIVKSGEIGADKYITQFIDDTIEIDYSDGRKIIFEISDLDYLKQKTVLKFGKMIKEIMLERGMNIYELSFYTGINERTLAMYFNNTRAPKAFDMLCMIYGLGYSLKEFEEEVDHILQVQ